MITMVARRRVVALATRLSVASVVVAGFASAALAAPPPAPPPAPATCTTLWGFVTTACPLTWYGVTLYGTVDLGVTYQTHGTPFDPNFPTGASYFLSKPNRNPGFGLAPNGLSQSVIGIKVQEPVGAGWSFVAQGELAYDPYSLLLANAPQALQDAKGVPQNAQALPVDSSRWGWLAAQNYVGFSSPYYGTLTFGRQNTPLLDGVNAYDPQGGSYAFSPIGFSGQTCGAGDTEECRWTTAIKYRENIGDFRLSVMGQPLGYGAYNPNNGAIAGGIGGDIKHLVPGIISVDLLSEFDKDAVNIAPAYVGAGTNPITGLAQAPFPPAFLRATISNQTSFMALLKYDAKPAVPFTFYAGYEWVQFANPSDPQSAFRDDGFFFTDPSGGTLHGAAPSFNNTSINNNAFNKNCGTGGGCKDEIFQVMWVGAKYGITNNLDVIGGYYHYIQNQYTLDIPATTCVNPTQHSQCAGTADMASAVIDWRFAPKWDWYIGTFYSTFHGGLINGYLAQSNLATTTGVRFRF
jgi:predicted porin